MANSLVLSEKLMVTLLARYLLYLLGSQFRQGPLIAEANSVSAIEFEVLKTKNKMFFV